MKKANILEAITYASGAIAAILSYGIVCCLEYGDPISILMPFITIAVGCTAISLLCYILNWKA